MSLKDRWNNMVQEEKQRAINDYNEEQKRKSDPDGYYFEHHNEKECRKYVEREFSHASLSRKARMGEMLREKENEE